MILVHFSLGWCCQLSLGGSKSLDRFQRKVKILDFLNFGQRCLGRVLVDRKVVCIGPDWCWKGLGVSVLVKKVKSGGFIFSLNGSIKSSFKMLDFLKLGQRRLGTPGMVLVDWKVVCIGLFWCLEVSGTVCCWSGTTYCTWGFSKEHLGKVEKSILRSCL